MRVKTLLKIFGILLVAVISYNIWYSEFNFNFGEISKDKVYKSGLIDPDKLEGFLIDNKIKTVIDLMDPGVQDELNPAKQREIDAEDAAIKLINDKYDTDIRHINIPSPQVPTKQTLTKFFEILDNEDTYPVLIHCYHGTGRAMLYSALYRIEYENWSNEDARAKTRFIVESPVYKSSFARGKSKGDFLINYKPRSSGKNATINTME